MGKEVSIVFSAAAGLGLQTAEDLCRTMLSKAGFYVFTAREYMSRVRGGNNSTQIRVSTVPVRAATMGMDWLFALSPGLRDNVTEKIGPGTRIVGDAAVMGEEIARLGFAMTDLELGRRAKEFGGAFYASTIVAGFLAGLFALPEDSGDPGFETLFAKKPEAVAGNKRAFREGHALGKKEAGGGPILIADATGKPAGERFLDGDTAVSLGAAAAGCNYVCTYPMSPGTGLFTYFARHARAFEAVVEQTEDEIGAVNMAVGAAYAGARAMVTTSGGGFALMTEGVSLAGMTETPLVVHIAQRPGPATGLATRTEQADLDLALYAGHGEFPRAIYAPVNVESCFRLSGLAHATAQKYQTPVFLLTDQYILDNAYDVACPNPDDIPEPLPPVESGPEYARYAWPAEGRWVSPRSVPGCGTGLVGLDSHEHTEAAHITESRELRMRMNDKRLAKEGPMEREALPPVVVGPRDASTLVVCWGSTFEAAREAMERIGAPDAALVACEQVHPVSDAFAALLGGDVRLVFVEGNATGQFERYVRARVGIEADASIRRYDGFPFTVDDLEEALRPLLCGEEDDEA